MYANTIRAMLLAATLFFVMPGIVGTFESHYHKLGKVIQIQDDHVYVQDMGGNIWCFIGEGYNRDEKVKLTMFDNHTGKINDDKVVKAEKL